MRFDRMRFDMAQRGGKGERRSVVGHAQGRLCVGLLVRSVGQARQPLRCVVSALIDEFRRGGLGGVLLGHPGGGRRGFPPGGARRGQQQHQQYGRCAPSSVPITHRIARGLIERAGDETALRHLEFVQGAVRHGQEGGAAIERVHPRYPGMMALENFP